MKLSTFAATTLATALASAMTDEQVQEINAIVKDINANQAQYIGVELNPPAGFTMPKELLQLYAKVITYKDESYTTLLADLDYDMITNTITNFAWYSDRLLPALEAVRDSYKVEEPTTTAAPVAAETTAAPANAATTATPAATTDAATDVAPAATTDAAPAATTDAVPADDAVTIAIGTTIATTPRFSNNTAVEQVATKLNTVTSLFTNTTTITSCPPESTTTNLVGVATTETTTETVCDEVCKSKKSESAAATKEATTETAANTNTATETTFATTTITKADKQTTAETESKTENKTSPSIEEQTANGAVKQMVGLGSGVLAAVALLI